MNEALLLIAAFCLDLVIGDPHHMPHPVKIIGRAIVALESRIRRFATTRRLEKIGGVLLTLLIVLGSFFVMIALKSIIANWMLGGGLLMWAGIIIYVFLISTTIAVKDLIDSAKAVIESVKAGAIDNARQSLSMIVGRDTGRLNDKSILKAAIETLAENLSDGIVAPLFYFALGGLPLAMTYKAINTLDSMVGYKNEKYINIGWASARLDDIANYLPARIAGFLIVLAVYIYRLFSNVHSSVISAGRAFRIMLRDGAKHSSPNSGVPEAAMAGGLGVKLGGPSTYGGIPVEKPFIGEDFCEDYISAADRTLRIVLVSSFLAIAVSALMTFVRGLIW